MLTDMWTKLAEAQLIPDGPFPVSLGELTDLVEKAKAGDAIALQKLKDALHWIPADQKLRMLTKAGIAATMELLRK